MNVYYTKGDKETIIKRINQIHTITLYCPLQDKGVQTLKRYLTELLPEYMENADLFSNVSTADALMVFLNALADKEFEGSVISLITGALRSFQRLKKVNFEFTNDPDIYETYIESVKQNKVVVKKHIYKIDKVEMILSDMFSQEVIDMINKVLIVDEIIPNSYFERKFTIDFKFDEYVGFMDAFLNNNVITLDLLDKNIGEYFRTFPQLIDEQKPDITLVTNYNEL